MSPGISVIFLQYERMPSAYIRIIEPLASRCSKFRFTPLDTSSSTARLAHIAESEKIDLSSSVISALISTSNGDLRRAITYLQSAQRLSAASKPPLPITPRDIQEIAGTVPDDVINRFAHTMGVDTEHFMDVEEPTSGAKRQLTEFERIRDEVKTLMREGYSATQILTQVR